MHLPHFLNSKSKGSSAKHIKNSPFVVVLMSFLLGLVTVSALFLTTPALAQSSRIAVTIPFEKATTSTGDLIVIEEGEYTLAKKSYHENMYGVVVEDPAISILDKTLEDANYVEVVSSGEA